MAACEFTGCCVLFVLRHLRYSCHTTSRTHHGISPSIIHACRSTQTLSSSFVYIDLWHTTTSVHYDLHPMHGVSLYLVFLVCSDPVEQCICLVEYMFFIEVTQ